MILGNELSQRAEGEPFEPEAFGQVWYDFDAGSLNLVQAVVERYISPDLWDSVFLPMLYWPAFVIFLAPGLVLVLLCIWRRRRRRVHG